MKQILAVFTTLALLSPPLLHGQEGMPEPEPEPKGMTLPDYITQLVELDEIGAADYYNLADGTVQVAMSYLQQQQKMPDPPLLDALDAVTEGRKLDPDFGDWDKVEQRLLDLLNNPPPQQQKQDQKDQSKNSESEDGEEGEQDPQQSGEQESQEKDNKSKNQESEEQDGEDGDSKQDESQDGEQQEQDDSQSSSDGEQGEEKSAQQPNTQDGAQMGELEEDQGEQDIQLDGQPQEQPKPPEQMQTIGGQESTGEPVDAEKAALMQMLDQLKQQDEPGKLYKILQEAQTGKKQKPQPNAKDW